MRSDSKEDIYVIYEGITEEKFLKRINDFFESKYKIILKNADGADNIPKIYKNIKKKNKYSNVVVMYDLDLTKTIQNIIRIFKDKEIKIQNSEIYFINPKFELVFILCKEEKTPTSDYLRYMKRLYDIENYEKTEEQIKRIVKQIDCDEVKTMIDRLKRLLSKMDTDSRSTNYDILFSRLFKII